MLIAALWLAGLAEARAVERFVPYGGTLNYASIQEALSACAAGDIVRVQPGIYEESITFPNRDITLTSLDPGDSNIVQSTVIQGDGMHSVVTFAQGQSTNCVLTGFTIRGGGGTVFSGSYLLGGGIYCYQSSPSIIGNLIEENHLSMDLTNLLSGGGAISCWDADPYIARNFIRNNSAYWGGAVLSVSGRPTIQDNWIYSNAAVAAAAAFLSDQGLFLNNTLAGNYPDNLYVDTTALVANNIIANFNPAVGVTANGTPDGLPWFQYNDVWESGGTEILLVSQEGTNTVTVPTSLAGTNGNISTDPLFVNATNFNLRLDAMSPCINAGDLRGLRSTNEVDIDGATRVFALRVDMGASEFHGARNFPPLANAGPDRTVYWEPDEPVVLDGSASADPEGSPLGFAWNQTGGPAVSVVASNTEAFFTPSGLGEYQFELVVNDGVYDSSPAQVSILVTNLPPVASAGLGQSLAEIPEELTLDGTHSLDPENQPLVYHWRQAAGPTAELSQADSPRAVFRPSGPGVYEFELTVSDAFQTSAPDRVVFSLGEVPPVADAGRTRYVSGTQIFYLDGSGSFAPNSTAPLQYAWRQISGPSVLLTPTNVVNPLVRVFTQTGTVRELEFELLVSADGLTSAPSTVKVVVVPAWSNTTISQVNPPFDTNRPTIFAFSGGNCDSGNSMSFPSSWLALANVFSGSYTRDPGSPTSAPTYLGYGDQFITVLSSVAPDYHQPIQTIGISTGCMPACDVAERFNVLYRDPRYLVNRITFLDSACARDYGASISNLLANRIPGRMFWIDNNYSEAGTFHSGTLNVQFPVPPATHGTPSTWYLPSWNIGSPYYPIAFNNGVCAGAFFSVVGPGKNYQLETGRSEYYFGWNRPPTASFPIYNLIQMLPSIYPARLPGVVELAGPTNGTLTTENKVLFSCRPALNAAKYQILVGPDADHCDQVAWEGSAPPNHPLLELPYVRTWWTLRVADAYGTTSWADPRYVIRDTDGDGLSDEAELLIYHTDPDNPDTDGDGHSDGEEVLAGTDPLRPDVGFQLYGRLMPTNQLRFSWFADPGKTYDLEFSTNLAASTWHSLQTFVSPATGGVILHTIPVPRDPERFYRLRFPATNAVGN